MTAKDKHSEKPRARDDKSVRQSANHDDLYDDGDMATPKRDFNEDEIKEEEDRRL